MDDSNTKPPATFHGWSRLPDELKVEILAHNLDQTNGIDSIAHSRVFAEQLTSIIGTRNHEFIALALETYYMRNVFQVTIEEDIDKKCAYVQHPPAAYGHLIRRMEVLACTHYLYIMLPRLLVTGSSAMRCILSRSPNSPLGGEDAFDLFALLPHDYIVSTVWQANFMHLQSLAFRFEYPMQKEIALFKRPGECDHCGLAPIHVEKALTAVQGLHIALQAAKTTVVFASTCPCLTRLAQLLARMATKSDK